MLNLSIYTIYIHICSSYSVVLDCEKREKYYYILPKYFGYTA